MDEEAQMKTMNKVRMAMVLSVILALAVVSTALAITIIIDGSDSDWVSVGGQTPGNQTDANEDGNPVGEEVISDQYDIEYFRWTNDQTYMYFLLKTYTNTTWTGLPRPTVFICLNTDNLPTGGSYANCNGMTGIDYTIVVDRNGVYVIQGEPNSGTDVSTGNEDFARVGALTEMSVELSTLGLNTGATCNQNITAAIYFDNGAGDYDDTTPDSGTFTIGCGIPTAVTLNSLSGAAGLPILAIALLGASVLAIGAVIFTRRRK
jgi:hypothetical protein